MLKDQTNITDREYFKITPCCDIGTQWIKNRERRVKKGWDTTYGYHIKNRMIFCIRILPTSLFHEIIIKEGQQKESGLGPYGLGTRNERGDQLLTFCQANNFVITNTQFPHHPRRRYTWISPRQERHQLDYVLINESWMSSFLDCKTRPGADHDSDHILLQAKIRTKVYKCQAKKIAEKH